jgi:hypothetical protein
MLKLLVILLSLILLGEGEGNTSSWSIVVTLVSEG